jgi:hypothetical protein
MGLAVRPPHTSSIVECFHRIPCSAEACATPVQPPATPESLGSLATASDLIDPTPLLSPFMCTQESWVIIAQDSLCHYDLGANRHVFHDRSIFEDYETISPLTVKGFGQDLSAVAVRLQSINLSGKHTIILTNVLHIPATRSNLVSGIQLDNAGVISTIGNKSLSFSVNNKTIVQGNIINDMYRLDLSIIPPTSRPLLSRITSASPLLLSQLEPIAASSDAPPAFYIA